MEPRNKLYLIHDDMLFMHGDNGRELDIHVGLPYRFNELYRVTNINVIEFETEDDNPHFFLELRLSEVEFDFELERMVYKEPSFEDITKELISNGDEPDNFTEELKEIALRGPIRNVEIYLDINNNNKITIVEHRDLGEVDYIRGFDGDHLYQTKYRGTLADRRESKILEYDRKKHREIIEWEEENKKKKEDLIKQEKKPKENVIDMDMEKENKKKEAN